MSNPISGLQPIYLTLDSFDSVTQGMLASEFRERLGNLVFEDDFSTYQRLNIEEAELALTSAQTLLAVAAIWIGWRQSHSRRERSRAKNELRVQVVQELMKFEANLPVEEVAEILRAVEIDADRIVLERKNYRIDIQYTRDRYLIRGKQSPEA